MQCLSQKMVLYHTAGLKRINFAIHYIYIYIYINIYIYIYTHTHNSETRLTLRFSFQQNMIQFPSSQLFRIIDLYSLNLTGQRVARIADRESFRVPAGKCRILEAERPGVCHLADSLLQWRENI